MRFNIPPLTRRNSIIIGVIVGVLFYIAYSIEIIGFGEFGDRISADFERAKTLWDWMDLFIVPVILAIGAYWFNRQAKEREEKLADDRRTEEAKLASERYKEEAKLANDRQSEAVLQKYFDSMAELILKKGMTTSNDQKAIKQVATMRTITVLRRLNPERVAEVVDFLRATELLGGKVSLVGAKLRNADLTEIDLSDLELMKADFQDAILIAADFKIADLTDANLSGANLTSADLNAATLDSANLNLANLSGANLEEANFTQETILPDGSNYQEGTDLTRFTDPAHPNFWKPTPPK